MLTFYRVKDCTYNRFRCKRLIGHLFLTPVGYLACELVTLFDLISTDEESAE